jgi:large subunit ribosomal protein L17
MRKRIKGRSLGRERAQKTALMRTLLVSLIEQQKITTTLAKARELRPYAERKISLAKRGLKSEIEKTAKTRLLKKDLPIKSIKALFLLAEVAKREGGYTRIVKLISRKSDFAKMAMIEWVDKAIIPEKEAPKKKAIAEKKAVIKKDVIKKEVKKEKDAKKN